MYAVGDLVAGLQLAHRGFAHGIFVAEEIAAPRAGPTSGRRRRSATATSRGSRTAIRRSPRSAWARRRPGPSTATSARSATTWPATAGPRSSDTAGLVKLVRAPDGPIVGIHLLGSRVGELMGEAQLITAWEAYPEDVAAAIHAHPTQSEAIGEAHLALAGKPLHVHG